MEKQKNRTVSCAWHLCGQCAKDHCPLHGECPIERRIEQIEAEADR